MWKFRFWNKYNILGVFQALWQIRIRAAYKTDIAAQSCVISTLKCVRIPQTCDKYEVWKKVQQSHTHLINYC